jgi:hypothetical protein
MKTIFLLCLLISSNIWAQSNGRRQIDQERQKTVKHLEGMLNKRSFSSVERLTVSLEGKSVRTTTRKILDKLDITDYGHHLWEDKDIFTVTVNVKSYNHCEELEYLCTAQHIIDKKTGLRRFGFISCDEPDGLPLSEFFDIKLRLF